MQTATTEQVTDVVVLGSGVAGLTAAVTASLMGLRVQVVEHLELFGGTSAVSSGTVWIPGNHLLGAGRAPQDALAAERYVEALTPANADPAIWRAFLSNGPRMLRDIETRTGIRFRPFLAAPDYRQDLPGAASGGRALEPPEFDGRLLGPVFNDLAWPIPELMVDRMMVTRSEAGRLLRADRSFDGLMLGLKLVSQYAWDRIAGYRRGTRLVLGNALVAHLARIFLSHGGIFRLGTQPQHLMRQGTQGWAIRTINNGLETVLVARRGVVLAGGGFPSNPSWRENYLASPAPRHTPASAGCDGSTIGLGLAVGGILGSEGIDNGLWFPASVAKRADGTTAVYPHIVLDRAKPGLIAVDQRGRRFANEGSSYHEFVRAMYRANETTPAIPAWLICDRKFLRAYGLGILRPRDWRVSRFVKSGYLHRGQSIAALGEGIGVPPDALRATVERYNQQARQGRDEDFGKGASLYDRSNGDPEVSPNPCMAPLATPPFYAVRVEPTPLGTSLGLLADASARVLDADRNPIPGLYVCGNDMQSAFGGEYPGGGAQLGQGMTFGWLAGRHLANAPDISGIGSQEQMVRL